MLRSDMALDQLEACLSETARALKTGEFSAMVDLAGRIDLALIGLEARPDVDRLKTVVAMAEANARLLAAAGRGIRAARRRIAEITDAQGAVHTYDIAGKSERIIVAPVKLQARF